MQCVRTDRSLYGESALARVPMCTRRPEAEHRLVWSRSTQRAPGRWHSVLNIQGWEKSHTSRPFESVKLSGAPAFSFSA